MGETERFIGVYPIIPTPFSREEEFDEGAKAVLRQVLNHAVEEGARGVIPCGGTSEWYALAESERKAITDITVEQIAGRARVFVGAMAPTTRDSVMYSRYAEAAGADGVMINAPVYSRLLDDELYDFFGTVADAVDIEIMIYNQPFATGVDMSPELLATLALNFDNITLVKESSNDLGRIGRLRDLCGDKLTVLWGSPLYILDALLLGASGCTSAVPPVALKTQMIAAVDKGNLTVAREIWERIRPVNVPEEIERDERATYYVRGAKAALELMGFRMGPPRRPVPPATDEERERIRKRLEAMGLLGE
jgi:4-hydroxy-tetrahydrodipicolinate synthase